MSACPYLGLYDDATIMLSETNARTSLLHNETLTSPTEGHQASFCLTANHTTCPHLSDA